MEPQLTVDRFIEGLAEEGSRSEREAVLAAQKFARAGGNCFLKVASMTLVEGSGHLERGARPVLHLLGLLDAAVGALFFVEPGPTEDNFPLEPGDEGEQLSHGRCFVGGKSRDGA